MSCEASRQYLQRPAEMLVLEGYRQWMFGIVKREPAHWNEAWNMIRSALGPEEAIPVMDSLVNFVRTLGLCAACPLRTQAPKCHGLNRDECLVLGLVSALQYDDSQAAEVCLTTLSCPTRCDEVAFAAGALAFSLKSAGLTLYPVPADVLAGIALEDEAPRTLH